MQVMRQGIEAGLPSLDLTHPALETSAQLNQILEPTIAALVNTMSYRDPYPASHQRRVAEQSVAIAKEEPYVGVRLNRLPRPNPSLILATPPTPPHSTPFSR